MDKKRIYCIGISIVAGLLLLTAILLLLFSPSSQNDFPYENTPYQAVMNGKLRQDVTQIDGKRYFSYHLVKETMDPYLWWDELTENLTVTNQEGIHNFSAKGGLEVILKEGEPYVSEEFLKNIYGVTPTYCEENKVSVWTNPQKVMGTAISLKNTISIRKSPSIKAPRVKVIEHCKGKPVATILDATNDGWFLVVSDTGEVGFIQLSHVRFSKNEAFDFEDVGVNDKMPGTPLDIFSNEKISMVWEAVYSYNPDTSKIGEMEGLDVIAPTWFSLEDATGTMSCLASKEYVSWAHGRGYVVWGTVTSYFSDPQVTSDMLHAQEVRRQFIKQLVAYAEMYELDGINVDFENMQEEDKFLFTQFVRELTVACHEKELVVSVCCTALSDSSYWSLCYDRTSLAASADYICLMLYDQHGAGSQVAGSVSQLSWAEASLKRVLNQIPAEKIILGMPFYTRLWKETDSMESSALYMEDAAAWVAEKGLTPIWDEESGQYYVFHEEDGVTYQMWLENAASIEKRVSLVGKYGLAGCAAWRRGFETEDIWPVIAEGLSKEYNQ